MAKKNKKSNYKVLAEAIAFDGLKNFNPSTKNVDCRKLTIDEIKEVMLEEFGKAKKAADEKLQEPEKGWGDAELAKEIEWMKNLDIQEFFKKGKK